MEIERQVGKDHRDRAPMNRAQRRRYAQAVAKDPATRRRIAEARKRWDADEELRRAAMARRDANARSSGYGSRIVLPS